MITLDHTKNDNIDIDLMITITDETHVNGTLKIEV